MLIDTKICSTLDCKSSYWRIPIDEQDRDKTTFVSYHGILSFVRISFRLTNSQGSFQRSKLVLMDIYNRVFRLHNRLFENDWRAHDSFEGRSFPVETRQLNNVASKTCNAVQAIQPPTSFTILRSFLGLCNVYRRLVSNFARIVTPLTNKPRHYNLHTFPDMNEAVITSFRHLKEALVKPPVRALLQSNLTYFLGTDECYKKFHAVLMQRYVDKYLQTPEYYAHNLSFAEEKLQYDLTWVPHDRMHSSSTHPISLSDRFRNSNRSLLVVMDSNPSHSIPTIRVLYTGPFIFLFRIIIPPGIYASCSRWPLSTRYWRTQQQQHRWRNTRVSTYKSCYKGDRHVQLRLPCPPKTLPIPWFKLSDDQISRKEFLLQQANDPVC